MSAVSLLGGMLAFSMLGIPLVFSILLASVAVMMIFHPGLPLQLVAQLFVKGIDSFPLLAIAFFFFAGELMNIGGITRRLVRFANALVGHIRGGLGHVGVVSSMFFAGISGSAVADGAAVGSVLIPSMRRAGYHPAFSAAVIQSASVMGPIIPPSIPMIIFAVLAEQSVGAMFLAGIVPGLLVAVALAVVVYVISRRRGYPRSDRAGLREVWDAALSAGAALLAPIIIVGGILGGIFTATEAGAIAVLYTLVIGRFVYRELAWREAWAALVRSAQGTATVLVILGASSVFGWVVADLRISRQAAEIVFAISENRWVLLLMMNLLFLLVGMFMDPLAALIVLVPIFLPIAIDAGVDPIHFGIIIVMNLMIGLCTPPVGYLIFLTARIAEVSPGAVIRQSPPLMAALLAVLLACTYIPALSLGLGGLFE